VQAMLGFLQSCWKQLFLFLIVVIPVVCVIQILAGIFYCAEHLKPLLKTSQYYMRNN